VATGRLTRLGLLVTRGHALETFSRCTHVVFDKTGTLTRGKLELTRVHTFGRLDEAECIEIAAAIERASEHPIAHAIVARARERRGASEVLASPGQGVAGAVDGRVYRVGSEGFVAPDHAIGGVQAARAAARVWLADETGPLAAFEFSDPLRAEARAGIAALREAGIGVLLLSGDAPERVEVVARELGIEEFAGGLLPEDKLGRVVALQQGGAVVVMVGDGVNDAPVLARAQVSIAMGGGTQLAQASADMILLSENIAHIAQAQGYARRTFRIIRQNLAWSLGYNFVAIPLAGAGFVQPWLAAIGMSASSLFVVMNALRLRAPDTRERPGASVAEGVREGAGPG
jgi:Cu2+-exporting ATPase